MINQEELAEARHYARGAVLRVLGCKWRGATEDVLQEACVKAWLHLDSYRGEAAFKSWFYSIAINQARMYLRSVNGKQSVMGHSGPLCDTVVQVGPSPEARYARLESHDRLFDKIKHLPPKLRGELLRFMIADKGDPLNQNNTRKARRFRAIQQLRQELESKNKLEAL